MNKTIAALTILGALCITAAQGASEDILAGYAAAGAGSFDPEAGRRQWVQAHPSPDGAESRSCTSCHGKDLRRPGRHVKTGKPIDPLAVSVNPARLRDAAKVEKWLRRNCRWTLGRACTAQEKGDFISYIGRQ
jgi:hypothetical protein